jgi:hypothetical protein
MRCAQRGPPGDRALEGAHDVDVARCAVRGDAGADGLELRGAHQLVAHQVRQFQIVEQQVEEFLPREFEDEVVLALTALARLPLSGA